MYSNKFCRLAAVTALTSIFCHSPAGAQNSAADRADPSVVEEELRREEAPSPQAAEPVVQAPSVQSSASAIGRPLLAGAILVEGAEALPQAAFSPVIERYAGRKLSVEELRKLAADIAQLARDAGYGLATAWIPPQQLQNGLLRVQLDEGRIDGIEVKGPGSRAVEPRLAVIATGKPVRTSLLERQLLISGDIAGIKVGKARLESRGGRKILVVTTSRDRVEGRAGLDNWGASTAGPVRGRASFDLNGLVTNSDSLNLEAMSTIFQPKEFALVAGRYSAALDNDGTSLSVGGYAAWSQAGGAFTDLDLDGRSTELEVEISHPLRRTRSSSIWAMVGGRIRDSEQSFGTRLARDDRMTIVSSSLFAVHRFRQGRVRIRAGVVNGIDAFGANDAGDTLSSRRDADGRFAKLEGWAAFERELGGRFSVAVEAEGQVADGPLLSSEEMGLGGRRFGRAWDYREFSGDRGIAGSIELRRDFRRPLPAMEDAQVYLYADAGAVDNYRLGRGGGSLASAGAGVRTWLKHNLRATAQIGVPLTDGADPEATSSPRLSFTLDVRF